MSSAIAGSAATVVITSPTIHNLGNNLTASNTPVNCSFASIYNPEIIHRCSIVTANSHEEMPLFIGEKKITINIRGTVYETYESTLERYPETLLGCPQKREKYYNTEKDQFCFERNREAFNAILYYYQSSGKLIRPNDIPEDVFLDDLEFFQIDPWNVAALEYGGENFLKPRRKVLKRDKNETDVELEIETREHESNNIYISCGCLLSMPCALFVILYMLTACLSTTGGHESILAISCANGNRVHHLTNESPLVIIHIACTLWFIFEFLLRLILSIMKFRYLCSFMGLVDISCILATSLQIMLRHVNLCQSAELVWFANLLRTISLICIFKLSRYTHGLRLFGQTLKACSGQLILSLYCVAICLLVFGTIIYYAEFPANQGFRSIVDALWYGIVTLTTVGYGDLVPRSILGRIAGALCSVFGVTIVMAWPATIFVSYFTQMYSHEVTRKKRKKRNLWTSGFYRFKKGLVRFDKGRCNLN